MKKRVLVLATVFVFVLAGILYAEEPGSIDGFRDYAWGTSFEEVSKDLENEFGIDGFNTEEFDEEEQTEENEIKIRRNIVYTLHSGGLHISESIVV